MADKNARFGAFPLRRQSPPDFADEEGYAPNRAFLSAYGGQKHTLSAQSIFSDVHAAGENDSNDFSQSPTKWVCEKEEEQRND